MKVCTSDTAFADNLVLHLGGNANRECLAHNKATTTHAIDDFVWDWLKEEVQGGQKLVKGLEEFALSWALGKALIGKRVGEKVKIQAPAREISFEIREIE